MTYNNRNYEWLYEQSIFAIQKAENQQYKSTEIIPEPVQSPNEFLNIFELYHVQPHSFQKLR